MKAIFVAILLGVLMGCTGASSQDSSQNIEPATHSTDQAPIPFGARVQVGSQDFITVTRVEMRSELALQPDSRRKSAGHVYIIKAPEVTPETIASFPTLSLVSPSGEVYTSQSELESAVANEKGFTHRAIDVLKVNGQILDVLVFEVPKGAFERDTWQVVTDNDTHIALKGPPAKAQDPSAPNLRAL
jgi:hypothetical protein